MKGIKFKSVFREYKTGVTYINNEAWGIIPGGFASPASHSNSERIDDLFYIGLKDKNEKEIFEKDIVFGWGANMVVEFVNGAAGYYTNIDTDWKEFHAFATHNHLSINNGVCKQLEVVGNIYETPNLVSGRHEAYEQGLPPVVGFGKQMFKIYSYVK